jgi:multiple sugar transport system permease protein
VHYCNLGARVVGLPMSVRAHPTRTRALQYVALAGYLAFLAFPLLWMLSTAFKGSRELASIAPRLIPENPTLGNFGDAVDRADLVLAATNSLQVALATTALVVAMALPAAYGLARFKTWLRPVTLTWILVGQVFPVILVALPLFLILDQFGLTDSLVGLTVVHAVYALPFGLWMLQGYITAIPRDVEEAAAVDGAGRLRILVSVVVPLLRPGVVATSLFTFISSWNEFFFALVLIQDPDRVTLPLTLARFVGAEGQIQLGALAAASLLATVPSLVFFMLVQRRLTSGLLSGAVKG